MAEKIRCTFIVDIDEGVYAELVHGLLQAKAENFIMDLPQAVEMAIGLMMERGGVVAEIKRRKAHEMLPGPYSST